MCGIAGALTFSKGSFRITDSYLTAMRDTMVHRGPDAGSNWISSEETVGLTHRRLAIIDLSAEANQPMSNHDGTIWIVFNGEIYNHSEIRALLKDKYHWKTSHSDTEVILHAFEEWGIECVKRFRGMFAFALWNARTKELWLVRDRVGIKPLYYCKHHERLVFASEIKALLKDPGTSRTVNEEGLFHYLSFLVTPAPHTLFDGILKLPPGCWLRVQLDGSQKLHRYWDVLDHTQSLSHLNEDDIAQELLERLRTSVRLRKVSDVPVGIFLSGGIDSSTNAVLFKEGQNQQVKTFSIGYDGSYPSYTNELNYARQIAHQIGADHHERILSQEDVLSFLPQMIHLQDEPIADPVCVPVYYVSKLAREHGVVVCQVGEGADELFCGYRLWKQALRLTALNELPFPHAGKRGMLWMLNLFGKQGSLGCEYLRRAVEGRPIFWGGAEAFTEPSKRAILSGRLRAKFREMSSWDAVSPLWQTFQEKAWEKDPLLWMSYLDLNFRLPELLLMRVDKMSMGVSLEGRVPFLDHAFVEFALSIPASIRFKHGISKYILKKAVKNLLPATIINRPKQGFSMPVYEWYFDRLGTLARAEILAFCKTTDYLDVAEVQRVFERRDGVRTWFLLNLVLWWKHYIAEDDDSELLARAA